MIPVPIGGRGKSVLTEALLMVELLRRAVLDIERRLEANERKVRRMGDYLIDAAETALEDIALGHPHPEIRLDLEEEDEEAADPEYPEVTGV